MEVLKHTPHVTELTNEALQRCCYRDETRADFFPDGGILVDHRMQRLLRKESQARGRKGQAEFLKPNTGHAARLLPP